MFYFQEIEKLVLKTIDHDNEETEQVCARQNEKEISRHISCVVEIYKITSILYSNQYKCFTPIF